MVMVLPLFQNNCSQYQVRCKFGWFKDVARGIGISSRPNVFKPEIRGFSDTGNAMALLLFQKNCFQYQVWCKYGRYKDAAWTISTSSRPNLFKPDIRGFYDTVNAIALPFFPINCSQYQVRCKFGWYKDVAWDTGTRSKPNLFKPELRLICTEPDIGNNFLGSDITFSVSDTLADPGFKTL